MSFRKRLEPLLRDADAQGIFMLALQEARRPEYERIHKVLHHLGRVAKPVLTGKCESARLRRSGSRFFIELSPGFLREYIETPQDLLHLVLHEVFHKVRGDLQRAWLDQRFMDERDRFVLNVAADILTDADLARLGFAEPPPYLAKLYKGKSRAAALLMPPAGLLGSAWPAGVSVDIRPYGSSITITAQAPDLFVSHTEALPREKGGALLDVLKRDREKRMEKARSVFGHPQLARLYLAGWEENPSSRSLFEGLKPFFPKPDCKVVFLGYHGDPEKGAWFQWLAAQLGLQAGYGDALQEEATEGVVPAKDLLFIEAVRRALEHDISTPRTVEASAVQPGVVPAVGRREAFFLAADCLPTFYPNPLRAQTEEENRVHIYVDVSGSTSEVWPLLYGLVLHCKEYIGEPIYIFSNQVAEVKLEDLRRGRVLTTGGTDFDCVALHAAEKRFRRILVVTDGYADLEEQNRRLLQRRGVDVYLVLTEDAKETCPLVEVARRWWIL